MAFETIINTAVKERPRKIATFLATLDTRSRARAASMLSDKTLTHADVRRNLITAGLYVAQSTVSLYRTEVISLTRKADK